MCGLENEWVSEFGNPKKFKFMLPLSSSCLLSKKT